MEIEALENCIGGSNKSPFPLELNDVCIGGGMLRRSCPAAGPPHSELSHARLQLNMWTICHCAGQRMDIHGILDRLRDHRSSNFRIAGLCNCTIPHWHHGVLSLLHAADLKLDAFATSEEPCPKRIYGYVFSTCDDNSWWCRKDHAHLDISEDYLQSLNAKNSWNGRKVSWRFIDRPPPGCAPPFLWFCFHGGTSTDLNQVRPVTCVLVGEPLHKLADTSLQYSCANRHAIVLGMV